MNRTSVLLVVLAAMLAGFLGSLAKDALVTPATAQNGPAARPIKIGVLDLEAACRASRMFVDYRQEWTAARDGEKAKFDKLQADLNDKKNRLAANPSDASTLRPEIAAQEEHMKAARDLSREFLEELLQLYQQKVIEHVMGKARDWCTVNGFNMVLQDYKSTASEGEMFGGAMYAERMLNKPILLAPGMEGKQNPFVIDITDQIVQLVKG